MANVVNYFEIGTPDAGATTAFYGDLFGWSIGEPSDGYRMVEGDKGGVWDTTAIGGGSWAIFYVHVDDVNAVIDTATGLGATVVAPSLATAPSSSPTYRTCRAIGSASGVPRADR
jgi:uncharacterized protein